MFISILTSFVSIVVRYKMAHNCPQLQITRILTMNYKTLLYTSGIQIQLVDRMFLYSQTIL